MSSEIAIEARDLSKAYLIYNSPADRLKQAVVPRLRRLLLPLLRAIGRGRGSGATSRNTGRCARWILR